MKRQEWDLTSKSAATAAAQKYLGYVIFPYADTISLAGKALNGIRSFLMDTVATPEQQKQAAKEIIRAARDANADEVEFTMDQEAAFGLRADIENANIELGPRRAAKMKVKVKFK